MFEKQVCMYKEKINYHESVEEEHKKNLEQQVDVILKMEEERLVLLKEHKESQQKLTDIQIEKQELTEKNTDLTSKVEMFEKELITLREDFKESKEQM